MSIKAINWAFGRKLSGSVDKAVLLALADYANQDGLCWPGIERLAAKASCCEKSARNALARLGEARYLTVVRQGGHNRGTNMYRLFITDEQPEWTLPARAEDDRPEDVALLAQQVSDTEQPVTDSPQPVLVTSKSLENPSEDPPVTGSAAKATDPADANEIVFRGKLLYLKRSHLEQLIKRYDCLPQAEIIDQMTELDRIWAAGDVADPPKNVKDAFIRFQHRLQRRNREAFERMARPEPPARGAELETSYGNPADGLNVDRLKAEGKL